MIGSRSVTEETVGNGGWTLPSLSAPFPWFGGKSRAADLIWPRFGDVPNYVEPFAGSLAVLLRRPHAPRAETVNDVDCFLSNFWRAVTAEPAAVAYHCDWPVNEADLHARHKWLVNQAGFRERVRTDPGYYDVKIAGWWVWGLCQWIGSGWCKAEESHWDSRPHLTYPQQGVHRKLPDLRRSGHGVLRKRPMLKMGSVGVFQKRVSIGRSGRGASSILPPAGELSGGGSGSGRGVLRFGVAKDGQSQREVLEEWFGALRHRLRRVRVCCGDWTRVLGPSPTVHIGVTGVLLDPPYGKDAGRYSRKCGLYAQDNLDVAAEVREWALAHGNDPRLRIALCGYEGEHKMPDNWECVAWKAAGGYARGRAKDNCRRERIWFSPHCLKI